jgi:rare lipoprotein A
LNLILFFAIFLPAIAFSDQYGIASFYSIKTNGGNKTASGEKLVDSEYTAAHRNLPFGTIVKVTNLKNKKNVKVRINDDGPHIKGRIIDLSKKAAQAIGMEKKGIVRVKVEIIFLGKGKFRH